ncbi:MAG: hypothetical protein EOP51_03240 [Sphingobacteriales bacterium]|nr:MAG: hypothetical protein EOP51_03240 [Sphingobacteriales bacterium]
MTSLAVSVQWHSTTGPPPLMEQSQGCSDASRSCDPFYWYFMVVAFSYLQPLPFLCVHPTDISRSLTVILFLSVAYLISPSIADLIHACLSLGLRVAVVLLVTGLFCLVLLLHSWLSEGRDLSSRVVGWLVLAVYLCLVIVAYQALQSTLACDEAMVVDFLLNASTPPKLDGQLGAYLAGLIEGDGTIFVPVSLRGLDGNLDYPTIKIYFHLDDKPLAMALKELLGYGSVNDVKGELTTALTVGSEAGVKDLIELLNGNFRTPKHDAFCRLVDWYQAADPLYTVEALPVDVSPLYSNAWLAGFADADSCFYIYATPSRVSLSFELVQGRVDHELIHRYLPIMQAIAAFLFAKLGFHKVRNASGSITQKLRARNTALAGAGVAATYFTSYPLLSSKWLNFLAWRPVYAKIVLRQAKDDEGYSEIKALKDSTNRGRTVFTWDHLKNMYTRKH